MKKILTGPGSNINLALLIIRVGLGVMMMIHGYPKLVGGVDKWEGIGSTMGNIGIDFMPVFWGFMAAFAEFIGGFLLAVGLFHFVAAFLLAFTMLIAFIMHYSNGDSFSSFSHSLELLIIFVGLILSGPGKYSLDKTIFK